MATITLKPFEIPNKIGAVDDDRFCVHVSNLPPMALSELCDEFRKNIFKAAGQDDPTKEPTKTPLIKLRLPDGVHWALRAHQIMTVEEIFAMSDEELLDVKRIGEIRLAEIKHAKTRYFGDHVTGRSHD